jgi:hypothetical protein
MAPAVYLIVAAIIVLVVVSKLPETKGASLARGSQLSAAVARA